MHLSIQKDQMLTPLQWVNGIIQKKQTMPILSHVLLDANNNALTMVATDAEVQLKSIIPLDSEIRQAGKTTVPARKLLDICRSLPDEAALELHFNNDTVYLRSGNARFTLMTKQCSEFPELHNHETSFQLTLTEAELYRLIHRTHFAMAEEDVRQYLNGLLIEIQDQTMTAVATDAHRLAYEQIKLAEPPKGEARVILPYKAVLELSKVLRQDETPLELHISQKHVCVESERFEFSTRLIDSRYPDYNRVIPPRSDTQLIIEKTPFRHALARAAILCNERTRIVQLQFRQGLILIYAVNSHQEEAEEVLTVDYKGPDHDIGFNVTYLLDVLNVIDHDTVALTVAENQNSAILEDPKASSGLFVIMAMQI